MHESSKTAILESYSRSRDSDPCILNLGPYDLIQQLEDLDDTIFGAVNGDPKALAMAENQWFALAHVADDALVEESREQYLRYANHVWTASRIGGNVGPDQVTAALEIIALLSR